MGAIAGVIFFICLLFVGLVGIGLGIAGLIFKGVLKRKQKSGSGALGAISIIVIVVSSLIALVPICFFSFIIFINAAPPEDFVETDIVIEENGYQSERFTADGVVYVALSFSGNSDYISEHSHPVFSYKTAGFMNGAQRGNYYSVDNESGFTLISDEYGLLFCPEGDKAVIEAYYAEAERQSYFFDGNELPKNTNDSLRDELDYDNGKLTVRLELPEGSFSEYSVEKQSDDGVVLFDIYSLVAYGGRFYLVHSSEFNGLCVFEASELSADASEELLAFLNK